MLDIEYLRSERPLKPVTLYTPLTTLFLQQVESRVLAQVRAKQYNIITPTPDTLLSELNSPSLFGEKYLIISLYDFTPQHKKLVETLCTLVIEKRLTTKLYLKISPEYQELLKDHPSYIGLLKSSHHIEQVTSSKGNLKKITEYHQQVSGYNITPSNPDVLQKALEHLLSQDETYQKPEGIELLWKKLDLIYCLCFKGQEFDLISYNHYIKKDQDQIGYFRIHEVLSNLLQSKKETREHAILQVLLEVDLLQHREGQDSRQALSRILYAIRDLFLINTQLGCLPETSSFMSKFKRQKLLPLGALEPTLITRLQNLILTQETLLRNSSNLALDLQIYVLNRFHI